MKLGNVRVVLQLFFVKVDSILKGVHGIIRYWLWIVSRLRLAAEREP